MYLQKKRSNILIAGTRPNTNDLVVGVDEVGRGPLAGPVTVGVFLIKISDKKIIKGAKDSKKLSAKQREEWFKYFNGHPKIIFEVSSVSASVIDKIGISKAISLAIKRALGKLPKKPSLVLLDGLLHAPEEYNQKTIIKGDEKEPIISAASIVAKVTRDRYMVKLSKKYPKYNFEKHKGYGTKEHYKMLKKHGISKIHRKSYLKKFNCNFI